MSRVFIEGFELRHLQNWEIGIQNFAQITSAATSYGLTGSYYYSCAGLINIAKELTTANEYYVSARYYFTSPGYGYQIFSFTNDSSQQLGVVYADIATGTNHLRFVAGGNTYVGSMTLATGTPYRIECRHIPSSGSSGVAQVKINGILDIDKTATYTSSASGPIKRVYFNGDNSKKLDDVVIDNSEWPGNTRIQNLLPDGAGTSTAWTPSAVANYDCVNDLSTTITAVDAGYVYASSVVKLDAYAMSSLISGSNPISEIKCIQVTARAKIDGVCTANAMKLKVITSNATYESSAFRIQEDAWAHYTYIKSDTANITVAKMENISIGLETTKV